MKVMRKLVMAAACAALAVFLGAQSASARCLSSFGGSDGDNTAVCNIHGETDTACLYICTCYGDCSGIYAMFGAKRLV